MSEPHARRRQPPHPLPPERAQADGVTLQRARGGEMAVWMERGGEEEGRGLMCDAASGWSSGTGRIDSQAAGRPPNLITGRNLRQKKKIKKKEARALINGCGRPRRGCAGCSRVGCERGGGGK